MVSSDFEISESVIVENIKQRIDFHSATNVPFWEPGSNFVIFKEPSKYSPCHLRLKRCCNENLFKIDRNWAARHFWRGEDVAVKFGKVVYLHKSFGKWVQLTKPI